ncbi:MAG: ParB/RepB/Spo0J family partition protein [Caldisericum exile]|jgi:ParB family chromosome partitioning protein|uniref:ParB/RepB/Spo0J family partition protein n=1 Tax=Caldisericum TaxID=693074 RepID=UPI003C772903
MEPKKGLPKDFNLRFDKGYVEELVNEKIQAKVIELNVRDIVTDPNQPRKTFNEESLKELAESIERHGVLEPILVRKVGTKYMIVAGERRYRATLLLKKDTIPAIVIDPKSDSIVREIQIVENLQREDISPIERAKAIYEYLKPYAKDKNVKTLLINYRMGRNVPEDFALTVSALCKAIGKTPITLIRWISLLDLPEDIQKKIDDPNSPLTSRHVESLLKVKDLDVIKKVVKIIEENELSSHDVANVVSTFKHFKPATLKGAIKNVENTINLIDFIDDKNRKNLKEELKTLKDLVNELEDKLGD